MDAPTTHRPNLFPLTPQNYRPRKPDILPDFSHNLLSGDFLKSLLQLLAFKDKQTFAHANRVYELAQEWVTYLRKHWLLLDVELNTVEIAALIHDVGKVGILDEVLQKDSFLTAEERTHMEQHSEIGYQLIRDYPGINSIALAVRHHHERWDGKGYPLGLKAAQIPVSARLIAIIDAYDAMTSDRPYQKARTHREALRIIGDEAGQQFCPEMASNFLQFMHARNT
jgi:HD-GYP domain-containing protein (c-di-GMP phosphodiesterase class II)